MQVEPDRHLNYLKNGRAVVLRRLLKSDREKILDGFDALSQLSRYRRFLHSKNELKQSEIDCLFTMPEHQGVSYIVLECRDTRTLAEGRCIGLIQMIELDSGDGCAEVALVVIDEFHNCGLGKLMLTIIETEAVKRKMQYLYFYTTADNQPLNAILKRTGWDISIDREFGSVTHVIRVRQEPAPIPGNKTLNKDKPANVFNPDILKQGQLLTRSWFNVCLRIMITMNIFSMYFYKGR